MSHDTLTDLYVEELRDLHNAATQLTHVLPILQAHATTLDLKDAFAEHGVFTKAHRVRIERLCRDLGVAPEGRTCRGMAGILADAADLLRCEGHAAVLDSAMISAVQRATHYQVAGFGTARTYAQLLGHDTHRAHLQKTLLEARALDVALTELALVINADAIAGPWHRHRSSQQAWGQPEAAADVAH